MMTRTVGWEPRVEIEKRRTSDKLESSSNGSVVRPHSHVLVVFFVTVRLLLLDPDNIHRIGPRSRFMNRLTDSALSNLATYIVQIHFVTLNMCMTVLNESVTEIVAKH